MSLLSRLAGLKAAAASCCVPGDSLLIAGSEEGELCGFDVESGQVSARLQLDESHQDAVSSVCCYGQAVYAAISNSLHVVDLRAGVVPVDSHHQCCQEEINQVCVNSKGTHLATADDSGTVQVLDLPAGRVFKRVQGAHGNMATCVSFRPHRPWELMTGGMDMTVARWDFSRGKCLDRMTITATGGSQMFNPPFVHALAVPNVPSNCRPWSQLLTAACGDGSVLMVDADQQLTMPLGAGSEVENELEGSFQADEGPVQPKAAGSSKQSGKSVMTGQSRRRAGGSSAGPSSWHPQALSSSQQLQPGAVVSGQNRVNGWVGPRLWDQQRGGHTRAAACLAFSWAGQAAGSGALPPSHLVSGGEDKRLLVWKLQQPSTSGADPGAKPTGATAAGLQSSQTCADEAGAGDGFACDIKHVRKVNCLSAGCGSSQHLLFVGDTSKRLCVYDLT